jgi:hypothetical protein
MEKVISFLEGKKTYIGVGLSAAYSVAIYFGLVESNEIIWAALLGWTGVSFRMAVK